MKKAATPTSAQGRPARRRPPARRRCRSPRPGAAARRGGRFDSRSDRRLARATCRRGAVTPSSPAVSRCVGPDSVPGERQALLAEAGIPRGTQRRPPRAVRQRAPNGRQTVCRSPRDSAFLRYPARTAPRSAGRRRAGARVCPHHDRPWLRRLFASRLANEAEAAVGGRTRLRLDGCGMEPDHRVACSGCDPRLLLGMIFSFAAAALQDADHARAREADQGRRGCTASPTPCRARTARARRSASHHPRLRRGHHAREKSGFRSAPVALRRGGAGARPRPQWSSPKIEETAKLEKSPPPSTALAAGTARRARPGGEDWRGCRRWRGDPVMPRGYP